MNVPRSPARSSLDAKGFWNLGRRYRLEMYRQGALSLSEMLAWASRAPGEVPKVNGEFEFIALHTAEVAD